MKKKWSNMEFTLQYYKWDDHATAAFLVIIDHPDKYRAGGNHTYYPIPLDGEEKTRIWRIAVEQGKERARAEVKRIFRERARRECSYKHYPFKLDDGNFIYLKGRYVKSSTNLSTRLSNAKAQKDTFAQEGWIYKEPIKSGTMKAVDGQLKLVEDEKEYTKKILENSQLCRTVAESSLWDRIRTQQRKSEEARYKRVEFLKHSIKVFEDILADKNKIPTSAYPFEHIDGCKSWEEDYRRRLGIYRLELESLTARQGA